MIASYARANEWAGIRADPMHRISMAVVSSTTTWHQSSRVAATVRSPFIATTRLDAAAPLTDDGTTRAVARALAAAGAEPVPVIVSIVDTIPPGPAGKRPLVVADRNSA